MIACYPVPETQQPGVRQVPRVPVLKVPHMQGHHIAPMQIAVRYSAFVRMKDQYMIFESCVKLFQIQPKTTFSICWVGFPPLCYIILLEPSIRRLVPLASEPGDAAMGSSHCCHYHHPALSSSPSSWNSSCRLSCHASHQRCRSRRLRRR